MTIVKEKCNAITTLGNSCTKGLGQNTDHPGEGRCDLHDDYVEGHIIEIFNVASINERMQQFLQDSNIFELDKEIVLSRAHLEVVAQYINQIKQEQLDGVKIENSKINIGALTTAINQTTRSIAKLLEVKNNIEVSRKYVIPVATLQYIIGLVAHTIDIYVKDPDIRESIHNDFKRIALPSPE